MAVSLSKIMTSNPKIEVMQRIKDAQTITQRQQVTGVMYATTSELQKDGLLSRYTDTVAKADSLKNLAISNQLVKSRIGFQTGLITQMKDKITQLKSQVIEYSAATPDINVPTFATMNLRQVALTLNSSPFGSYEFGGMSSDIPPVEDVEAFITTTNIDADGNLTSNYTKLIKDDSTNLIDENREIKVSIDAAHPAFQNMIGALHKMIALTPTADKTEVLAMLEEAFNLFQDMEVYITFNDKILDDADASNEFMQEEIASVFDQFRSDISDLVSQSQEQNQQLQVSMYALSLANRTSLLDFIR